MGKKTTTPQETSSVQAHQVFAQINRTLRRFHNNPFTMENMRDGNTKDRDVFADFSLSEEENEEISASQKDKRTTLNF